VVLQKRLGIVSRGLAVRTVRSCAAALCFLPYALWSGGMLAEATDPARGRTVQSYVLFGYGLATAMAVFAVISFVLGAAELAEIARRIPVVRRWLRPFLDARYGARI
jgi:hypothetical protein